MPIWTVVLLGPALVFCMLQMRGSHPPYVDDAYIYLRYARNIAGGLGHVWNAGSSPVEGYTSILYQLLLVGFFRAGITSEFLPAWIGFASAAAAVAMTAVLAQEVAPGRARVGVLSITLLALSPPFIRWTTAGLETMLYTALFLAALLAVLAYLEGRLAPLLVGIAHGLLALARPEGAVILGGLIVFEAVRRGFRERSIPWRDLLGIAAGFLLVFGPSLLWRWTTFGYPFPNTYYAKTGGGWLQLAGGVRYLVDSFGLVFGGPALCIVLMLLFALRGAFSGQDYSYLPWTILITCAIVGLNGGDHFEGARFLLPVLPLVFVLAASGLDAVWGWSTSAGWVWGRGQPAFALVLVWLAVLGWSQSPTYVSARFSWHDLLGGEGNAGPEGAEAGDEVVPDAVSGYIQMGEALREMAAPTQSIAVVPIGAIGYYSEMRVIDMVGIVDPIIAHEPLDPAYARSWRPGHDKGDGLYVLGQQPDFIQFIDRLTDVPQAGPDERALQYKSIAEIWSSPEFHSEYSFSPIRLESGRYYNLYRRIER